MKQILYILLGWGLTVAVSWCAGKVLLRGLKARLARQEEEIFAFLAGSACLSTVVFLLAALDLADKAVFLAISVLAVAGAARMRVWRPQAERLRPVPPGWRLLFIGLWLLFGAVYFIHALAPEASPDGTAYHLALVARYAREHGFPAITNNFFASFPQGMEMLFLFAFVWGRHSAAALVHLTYLLVLPWLILNFGRRIGMPAAGAAGGLLIFLAPVAGIDGSVAYNDVALATVAFAVFVMLEIWNEERENALLLPVGLVAGFAFAIKYTGFVAAAYAAGFIAYCLRRSRKPVLRPLMLLTLSVVVLMAPTLIKNWIVVRNPVSPFFNRVFPNPYVHVSFEDEWTRNMRSYEIHSPWQLAYETTTGGYGMGGLLGPVFLLAPLSLVALRYAPGRRLLLAALVFLVPYPSNLGTRFLLPAAAFLAPAIAMGLAAIAGAVPLVGFEGSIFWPARLGWNPGPETWHHRPVSVRIGLGGAPVALLVAFHAVLSWPTHIGWYSHRYAWHLSEIPVRAALRLESEDEYLSRWMGDDYKMVRFIERATPPESRILSLASDGPPAAYCAREILPSYFSALNRRLCENLYSGFNVGLQPTRVLTFRIAPQPVRGLRLIESGSSQPTSPSINELRIFGPSGELNPAPGWHFDARPFPWDAGLAFDRNPVTRWDAWQETRKGAWIDVDLKTGIVVSAVRLETMPGQAAVQWELQGKNPVGEWRALSATPEQESLPGALNLRRAATTELKRNGIRFILDTPFYAAEFQDHARDWGIKPLAEFGTRRLYQIQ